MASALTGFIWTSCHNSVLSCKPFHFSLAAFQTRNLWLFSQSCQNSVLSKTSLSRNKQLCRAHTTHFSQGFKGGSEKRFISGCGANCLICKYRQGHLAYRTVGLLHCCSAVTGRTLTLSCNGDSDGLSVSELASTIVQATKEVDVMAGSLPPTAVEILINNLFTAGMDARSVERMLSGKLWLLKQSKATVDTCRLLLQHGVSAQVTCNIMSDIPFSLQKDVGCVPSLIIDSLMTLKSVGFSEKETISLLKRDSSVLFIDMQSIRIALTRIKQLFPAAESKTILCMSPNILSDDWTSIQKKYEYAIRIMGYLETDLLKTHYFSHSFRHIEDRHLFLYRAKVFKRVNPKLDPALNPNPPLKLVVDSSDQSFVTLVDGVSLEDYGTFRKMRMVERETELSDEEGGEKEESDDEDLYVHQKQKKKKNRNNFMSKSDKRKSKPKQLDSS